MTTTCEHPMNSAMSFPSKLFFLMDNEHGGIIHWLGHGRAFRVIDTDRFCAEIIPKYFKRKKLFPHLFFSLHNIDQIYIPLKHTDTKLTSFQRQLNLYGFRRINKGEDQGAYSHPKFQRGRKDLLPEIKRLAAKTASFDDDIPFTDLKRKFDGPVVNFGSQRDVMSRIPVSHQVAAAMVQVAPPMHFERKSQFDQVPQFSYPEFKRQQSHRESFGLYSVPSLSRNTSADWMGVNEPGVNSNLASTPVLFASVPSDMFNNAEPKVGARPMVQHSGAMGQPISKPEITQVLTPAPKMSKLTMNIGFGKIYAGIEEAKAQRSRPQQSVPPTNDRLSTDTTKQSADQHNSHAHQQQQQQQNVPHSHRHVQSGPRQYYQDQAHQSHLSTSHVDQRLSQQFPSSQTAQRSNDAPAAPCLHQQQQQQSVEPEGSQRQFAFADPHSRAEIMRELQSATRMTQSKSSHVHSQPEGRQQHNYTGVGAGVAGDVSSEYSFPSGNKYRESNGKLGEGE